MGTALFSNKFLPIPLKISIHMKKKQQQTLILPVLLAHPTSPTCAGALPQELGHLFCSRILLLSSGVAFGSDCQMTCRGLNLDSNLNSAAWPMGCRGLSALKTQNNLCWVWIFRSDVNAKIEDSCELIPTLIHQTDLCTQLIAIYKIPIKFYWLWQLLSHHRSWICCSGQWADTFLLTSARIFILKVLWTHWTGGSWMRKCNLHCFSIWGDRVTRHTSKAAALLQEINFTTEKKKSKECRILCQISVSHIGRKH